MPKSVLDTWHVSGTRGPGLADPKNHLACLGQHRYDIIVVVVVVVVELAVSLLIVVVVELTDYLRSLGYHDCAQIRDDMPAHLLELYSLGQKCCSCLGICPPKTCECVKEKRMCQNEVCPSPLESRS